MTPTKTETLEVVEVQVGTETDTSPAIEVTTPGTPLFSPKPKPATRHRGETEATL